MWIALCLASAIAAWGYCSSGRCGEAQASLIADKPLVARSEEAKQTGPGRQDHQPISAAAQLQQPASVGRLNSGPENTLLPAGDPETATEEISGPRELLRMLGVDDGHFDLLADGRPWRAEEDETLMRVMFRFRDGRFSLTDMKRWSRGEFDLAKLVEDRDASRGQVYRLAGRVSSAELVWLSPEAASRFELAEYYRCRLLLGKEKQPAIVFTPAVASQWQVSAGRLDERASALGLFLKLAAGDGQEPLPVFVAPRIAWHPAGMLGELGMDMGLLDGVEDKKGLTRADREGFYQMLAAVGRAEPGELLREANRQMAQSGEERFSVVPLFEQAREQRGRLVVLGGRARRVIKIRVSDPDIRARLGIDHYYEIGLFTDDSGGNPITFCIRELPPGMPSGDDPQFSETVTVAGFYFKMWAYRTAWPADAPVPKGRGLVRIQPSPLLIGRELLWRRPQQPVTNTLAGAIAGGLFVLAILGIWFALWRNSRSDKRFHQRTIAKARTAGSAALLDELGRIPKDRNTE